MTEHVENKHKKLSGEIDALWLLYFNMNIIDQPCSYCMIAYRQVKSVVDVGSIRVTTNRHEGNRVRKLNNQMFTWATHESPIRKKTKHTTAMKISLRLRNRRGHSSTTAVMKPSRLQNCQIFKIMGKFNFINDHQQTAIGSVHLH